MKILIVDDLEVNLDLLEARLEGSGYEVTSAMNGIEALEVLKTDSFDMIISDILMPEMDGYQLCRECKKDDTLRKIPFVFYTATYTDKKDEEFALSLGANRFIVKPMESKSFMETIEGVLKNLKKGLLTPSEITVEEDDIYLKGYNERLINKLEKKTLDLEREITERKQAEEEILKSERRYRTLFEDFVAAIVVTSQEGKLLDVNQAALDLLGYTKVEIMGMNFRELYVDPSNGERFQQQIDQKGSVVNFEVKLRKKDGTELDSLFTVSTKRDDDGSVVGYQGFIRDITDQKKLEAQFLQAQKMEAIGTLAGGIAHDFNNLLTTIIGNAHIALMDVIEDESLRKGMEQIKKAGKRAASLTRQLLAFSRKQVIKPEVLDLNEVINETEKMLKRMIGEDIEFQTVLKPELWKVYIDSGQVDQIIINIVVNARDAMPQGGKLTIETANVELKKNFFREHGIDEKPGSYVVLAISDTGSGMNKETQEHIFEPFFTTKEIGKGTGLGLSTVYGIAKQNNGFIWVYSEPGQGTTFKIYLPKVKEGTEPEEKKRTPESNLNGSETIFLVEDDDRVRNLTRKILERYGYSVLEAEDGEDALMVSEEHEGQIDLMLTDVVMPKMSGRELTKRLKSLRPEMKVIYMSGYTDNAIAHQGVLAPGINFLEKPFTPEGLARKVREVLDQGN